MGHKRVETLAAIIFTVVAVVHILRLIYAWEVSIGGWMMPVWASVVAIVLTGILAIAFWKSAIKGGM